MSGRDRDRSKVTRRQVLATVGKGALAGSALFAGTSLWQRAAQAAEEVNVLAFGGYEEPGMLEPFEQSTGIKVNLKTPRTVRTQEMVALIASSPPGTFDIITPPSAYIPRAVQDGLLMELDPSDYPLDDYFDLIAKWPPVWTDGKMDAIVNRFGYYGITYNHNKYSESDVSSYSVLWEERARGRVALFDWFLPNMGCLSKYDGNATPYDLSDEEFGKLESTLMSLRPQVGLVGNTSQVIQAMAGGSYESGDRRANGSRPACTTTVCPSRPWCRRKGESPGTRPCASPRTRRAPIPPGRFLQYVTGPEFQAKLAVARTYYSMVPNKNAATMLPQDKRELLNLADLDKFTDVFMANLSPRKDPANRGAWLDAWERFKNA